MRQQLAEGLEHRQPKAEADQQQNGGQAAIAGPEGDEPRHQQQGGGKGDQQVEPDVGGTVGAGPVGPVGEAIDGRQADNGDDGGEEDVLHREP